MYRPRHNTHAAAVVNDGLAMLATATRYHAAHFMRANGVSFRVIVRVLAPAAKVRAMKLMRS